MPHSDHRPQIISLQHWRCRAKRDSHLWLIPVWGSHCWLHLCHGQPTGEMRHGGVGFTIRTKLTTSVCESSCAISPRLMRFQLNLEGGHVTTLFSCYAPTLAATQEEKQQFYDQLSSATNTVPFIHQLFILGDFNARVGKVFKVWNKIVGHRGIGNKKRLIAATILYGTQSGGDQHGLSTGRQIQGQLDASSLWPLAPYWLCSHQTTWPSQHQINTCDACNHVLVRSPDGQNFSVSHQQSSQTHTHSATDEEIQHSQAEWWLMKPPAWLYRKSWTKH